MTFKRAAAALACTLLTFAAAAEDDFDANRAVVFSGAEIPAKDVEFKTFSDAALSAAVRSFSSRGLSVSVAPAGLSGAESDTSIAAARDAGAGWAIAVRVRRDGRFLSWRFNVYETSDSTLRASDAYSAFAGLSVFPLIEESAERVAAAWSLVKDDPGPPLPISYKLRFSSPDAGVSVSVFQGEDVSRDFGVTDAKAFEAAYIPLMSNTPFRVEISRDGYWPETVELSKGPTRKPIKLPALYRKTRNALIPSVGMGRLLGGAIGYRRYLDPDSFYLRAENIAWIATDFTDSSRPVYHDEVRLGCGAYLTPNRSGLFRVSVGTGVSGIATYVSGADGYDNPAGFDATLDVFWFTLEYHRPTWAFVLEERFPYSLGLSSGFLPAGWLELEKSGPLFLAAGVMFKW